MWQHDRLNGDLTKQRSSPHYLIKDGRERSVSETRLEKVLGWVGSIMGMMSNMCTSRPQHGTHTAQPRKEPAQRAWTPVQSLQNKYWPTEAIPRPCSGYLLVKYPSPHAFQPWEKKRSWKLCWCLAAFLN